MHVTMWNIWEDSEKNETEEFIEEKLRYAVMGKADAWDFNSSLEFRWRWGWLGPRRSSGNWLYWEDENGKIIQTKWRWHDDKQRDVL